MCIYLGRVGIRFHFAPKQSSYSMMDDDDEQSLKMRIAAPDSYATRTYQPTSPVSAVFFSISYLHFGTHLTPHRQERSS